MAIDFLRDTFLQKGNSEAIVWRDHSYSYQWLLDRIGYWKDCLGKANICLGTVAILEADFSPNSIALLLALIEQACIVVPLSASVGTKKQEFFQVAHGEVSFVVDSLDQAALTHLGPPFRHALYQKLRQGGRPGLVLLSSGSTGQSKAAVHDVMQLLAKFMVRRRDLRTLAFLLFDHIGGLDTLFYSLSNGSCLVTVQDRSPAEVCSAIEKHRVEVLPTSPTFLKLLLMSEVYHEYDLSSLKYITYGTEVMSEMILKRCAEIFPRVTLLQKYGTTEVGTLRSQSKSSDSLWVRVGGEDCQTCVVDGILQIKAKSAMLGYLNASSPFTPDGWFNTGDSVEVDGDYIRILGRASEIINVGGQKVHPAEIENVIQQMPNVEEVIVYGEKHPITGNIVCAKVRLSEAEDPNTLPARLKQFCRGRLQNYQIPIKVFVTQEQLFTDRFKKKIK